MADGSNALNQMPPWGWGILLLGSGGGIGTLSGLSMGDNSDCVEPLEMIRVESELQAAHVSLSAANATIQSLIEVIKENKSNDGWIE